MPSRAHTQRPSRCTHNPNHSLTSFRDVQLSRTTAIAYDAAERPTLIDESWDEEAGTPPAERKSRDTLLRYDRDGNVLHRLTDGQANGDNPATFAGGKTTSFRYDGWLGGALPVDWFGGDPYEDVLSGLGPAGADADRVVRL
jgi:hypothetical protein